MLKRTNAVTSGLVLIWYLFAAANGWKGWNLAAPTMGPGTQVRGTTSGGHGSVFSGGWGGGK